MKKTYKSSLLALSVLASFTSCSESESLQQANLSKDKITFHATLDNSWKPLSPASSSRAAIAAATEKGPIVVSTPFGKPLYLHSVVQETADLLQAAATTRGAMHMGNTLGGGNSYTGFGVTAIYNNGTEKQLLLRNEKATELTEKDEQGTPYWGFANSNAQWPGDAEVTFHAYAPHSDDANNMLGYEVDKDNVKTKITYTAAATEDDIKKQPDLIVATNTGSQADAAVNLKFSHALTAVSFALSSDLVGVIGNGYQLEEIKLTGVPFKGVCELKTTDGTAEVPSCTWTLTEGEKCDYTFNLTQKNIIINNDLEDMALTDGNQILMMIPQTLTGAQLTFTFKLNNHTQKFEIQMPEQIWEAGKSVIYKLSANAINTISHTNVVYHDLDTWRAVSYPKSNFENNEEIGLCIVGQGNKVVTSNMKLKLTDGTWMTEEGKKFLMRADYKYFAYYPYDANITEDMLDANATTAEGFFAKAIANRPLVADQSDKQKLESADFQVAMGEPIGADASTMTFKMAHQVGLAVLNLTSKNVAETRQFKNDHYKYYYGTGKQKPVANDYTDINPSSVLASNNFEGANKPYNVAVNKYLQIIPFNKSMQYKATEQEGARLSAWGKLVTWTFTPTDNNPVVKNITVDADFKYLARLFNFTGNVETFQVPENATYTLQCWGAGSPQNSYGGGYTFGDTDKQKDDNLYVCVGEQGKVYHGSTGGAAAYNGGGAGGNGSGYNGACSGGGATHIGLKNSVLTGFKHDYSSRLLLVAGGQGGHCHDVQGGYGGGTIAGIGQMRHQDWGYTTNNSSVQNWYIFGEGKKGRDGGLGTSNGAEGNGGGGGGFYGGYSHNAIGNNTDCSGGGGTGYVNDDHLIIKGGQTIAGNQTFDAPGGGKETGHQGNGAAQISWLPSQLTRVK